MTAASHAQQYRTVSEVSGPLMIVREIKPAAYGELVKITSPSGERRTGTVLEAGEGYAIVQVFEGTRGLDVSETEIQFTGETLTVPLSPDMLGRVFNGRGQPLDGGPSIMPDEERDINGEPINPSAREYPKEFIQTGISSIDGLNTLSRGQKLPIFTGSGLPHNLLTAQIARQAKIPGKEEDFVVVFAAMGITSEEAIFFRHEFEKTGSFKRLVMYSNLANDPAIERIITPRLALTAAEYLAYTIGYHVLVIMTDMLNYGEALREVSAARNEVPGRRGFPGYLYTDLATIYERCGRIIGREGTITLLPIITMPGDDITHPVVDLSGYITEGQLILDRAMHNRGIYPPMNVLPSLSRLMKEATRYTRRDHDPLKDQLYYCYSEGVDLRALVAVIGGEAISERDRRYLDFADVFEKRYIAQGYHEERDLETTLSLGWELLGRFIPESEIKRVDPALVHQYFPKSKKNT